MKKQLLIAGGSGLIGEAIQQHPLAEDWEITILSRKSGTGRILWDPALGTIKLKANQSFDAIINLAGTSIAERRWSEKRKNEIYTSRINSCKTLERYIRDGRLHTDVYVGASGIGIYGDRGETEVDEQTPISGDDWMIRTAVDWESGHNTMASLGIRKVICRIGIVLSREGGALYEILQKSKLGVLAYFGRGHQIWSWIHIEDLVSMIYFALDNKSINGVYLATAVNPVSNKKMIQSINRNAPRKKIIVGVPGFLLAIILGGMHRTLFDSCRAPALKIEREGFHAKFRTIDEAMSDLMNKTK